MPLVVKKLGESLAKSKKSSTFAAVLRKRVKLLAVLVPLFPLVTLSSVAAIRLTDSLEYKVEMQASLAEGEHEPLWLNANKYGLSSLSKSNAYLRAQLLCPLDKWADPTWDLGYGIDLALASGFTSKLVVQQAYAELKYKKGLLTVGAKEFPMELKNQRLSSGSQALGINARPVPQLRLELPDYWTIPGLGGWAGLKGHVSYGMLTDNNWQKGFTERSRKHAVNTLYHSKAGYVRLGKPGNRRLTVEAGLEMACLFAGDSYLYVNKKWQYIPNEKGVGALWHALIPSGGETIEPATYKNTSGDDLGAWVLRLNYDHGDWQLSLYGDHFFDDESALFMVDYDGYGHGQEWNVKKDWHFFLYDMKDIMLGVELQLRNNPWLSNVVVEYLSTKYQSGPIYHDHTPAISYHLGGRDNYYNHFVEPGWQHWGQVMGNPLFRSPLYNDSREISVENNRFTAWHLGAEGKPLPNVGYRLLATTQTGYGTYDNPYFRRKHNFSLMGEVTCGLTCGWSVTGAVAFDKGSIYGGNSGIQLTVSKKWKY